MKVLKAVLLIFIFALSAYAQETRGRIQGAVTDQSQAVVPGAKVTLSNIDTGISVSATTGPGGDFIFNLVPPGNYRVSVDAAGFEHWVQENVIVQTLADVTVNAAMKLGSVSQAVEVTASPTSVQFNTTTMSQTVDGTMLKELPIIGRNPFTLSLLNPAVVNYYWDIAHRNPFFSMAANGVDVGNTLGRNDVQLDGVTLVVGSRSGWIPPMDAVQEVVVQQNAVDAQFGQSAGGILSVATKAGTNDLHGMAYYYGRNPDLNAVSNSVSHTPNEDRYNIFGVNAGGPIKKNKLFFFGSYEKWHSEFPSSMFMTLPTAAERQGDYSQSLNQYGTLRTIYDPFSTTIDPVSGAVARTPFQGNKIPANCIDPNRPGFHVGRVAAEQCRATIITPTPTTSNSLSPGGRTMTTGRAVQTTLPPKNWHIFYRYSQFREWESNNNYSGDNSPAFTDYDGGLTATINTVGDALYTINSSTVLDMRFGSPPTAFCTVRPGQG